MTRTAQTAADTVLLTEIPDHSGTPRRPNADLFVPPPPEIGEIVTADSTLDLGRAHRPLASRLAISFGIALVVYLVITFLTSLLSPRNLDVALVFMLTLVVTLVAFAVPLIKTSFHGVCSYVGEKGIARTTLKGCRDAKPIDETLLFEHADELRASQTQQYINGFYAGTNYSYVWHDSAGNKLLTLSGTHRGRNDLPKKGNAWHFASSAEMAWSRYYFETVQRQLKEEGAIAFRVDKRRVIRVGLGFLEFHFGGEPTRIKADDLATVSLAQGMFSFKHKDARWFSSAGKFSFNYSSMANAQVFVLALDRLIGISLQ